MIPPDILLVLVVTLLAVVPFVILRSLGKRIARKRQRLVEPDETEHRSISSPSGERAPSALTRRHKASWS